MSIAYSFASQCQHVWSVFNGRLTLIGGRMWSVAKPRATWRAPRNIKGHKTKSRLIVFRLFGRSQISMQSRRDNVDHFVTTSIVNNPTHQLIADSMFYDLLFMHWPSGLVCFAINQHTIHRSSWSFAFDLIDLDHCPVRIFFSFWIASEVWALCCSCFDVRFIFEQMDWTDRRKD